MTQGIIIVTSPATKPFLDDLLVAIGGYSKHPIVVHMNEPDNNEYEIGGIKRGLKAKFDEFFLLPDTCMVKDTSLFDIAFEQHQGKACSISPNFLSYTGKYRRETLLTMALPHVQDKASAVDAEAKFLTEYVRKEGRNYIVLYPEFDKNYTFREHNGRQNMVLECDTLIKYKGTWDPKMIKPEPAQPVEKPEKSLLTETDTEKIHINPHFKKTRSILEDNHG